MITKARLSDPKRHLAHGCHRRRSANRFRLLLRKRVCDTYAAVYVTNAADFHVDGPPESAPWTLSPSHRDRILRDLRPFRDSLPDFVLPSRHTLSRHLEVFFLGFNRNLPFLHHTWNTIDSPVELTLSICAIGAQNCCEHAVSRSLFQAASTVQKLRLHQNYREIGPRTSALLNANSFGLERQSDKTIAYCPEDLQSSREQRESWRPIDALRSQLLLLCYSAWADDVDLVQTNESSWTVLGHLLADLGTDDAENECSHDRGLSWKEAMQSESHRRAKLSALSFLTTTSIAYDFSGGRRPGSVRMKLPCSQNEWEAKDDVQWVRAAQQQIKEQLCYDDALHLLLTQSDWRSAIRPLPSSFGNYLLIHGLLSRILVVRELNNALEQSGPLAAEHIERLEFVFRSKCGLYRLTKHPDERFERGPKSGSSLPRAVSTHTRTSDAYPQRQVLCFLWHTHACIWTLDRIAT